jgi:hypothetical protein
MIIYIAVSFFAFDYCMQNIEDKFVINDWIKVITYVILIDIILFEIINLWLRRLNNNINYLKDLLEVMVSKTFGLN